MVKIICTKKLCLTGKAKDVFREIHKMSLIHSTLEDAISHYQDKLQQLYQQPQEK